MRERKIIKLAIGVVSFWIRDSGQSFRNLTFVSSIKMSADNSISKKGCRYFTQREWPCLQ